MDGRVARVCSYYMACKNSCQRVCLPHFIDEIVDQTDKMLDVSTVVFHKLVKS